MQRNLPHIISQATSAPLLLEPAYARVFFCALGRESGINSLHIPGNNESLDQSDMALVTGDFMATGKPQARFYQVVNGIAVLPVTGTLVHKLGGMRPFSGMTGYDGVTARLQQAVSDPEVKGILLDIDSPGGQAAGAFDCADMIYRMREQKPVWALANETACSAAMLLAAACSHRLVTQTSRMGSIGVVMAHTSYAEKLKQEGIDITLIYSGAHKADLTPSQKLPESVHADYQQRMDEARKMFAEKVARYTGLSVDAVMATEAAVYDGQASNDAAGYLDFFKGQITESHLGKELLEKVELTEDNASKLQQFSKEWQDANDKWNAMWGIKIEQTKDGKYYVAGLGLSMEDMPDGKISQFLVAADRIAYINPANGNETPGFVMQGDQIIMNEAFLKYLSAPTITSGGNPPAFSLTPDGKLTAKNADISGHINAVSGSFTGEINATSGKFSGVIEAREFVGDICGSKVMQGVSIRATNDERSTSTRYTDSATYQIGKTITVMANCERNGGSGAITVTININGQVKTAEVMPYTAGIPAMYQTVVFSVYTTSPVVDISVSLRVRGQYTTEASVWPLVMVSRSGSNFTN
ncbi:TPA: S49 family peptidase [Salmonella enterica subsp. enterica serovar Newport]